MVLKIYHCAHARSTRSVWLYHELTGSTNVPDLDVIKVDFATFRTSKPTEFLKLNPNGKVPLLIDTDNNVTMWDSCAISFYLLDTFDQGHVLAPKYDTKFRALLHQFAFYCSGTVDNLTAMSSPVQRIMDNPTPGTDPQLMELNKKALKEICGPLLSQQLAENSFMYGNKFTALDVIVGYSIISLKRRMPEALAVDFPTLDKYAERLMTREAYIKATK